jgi:uncharacterized membrane protein YdbT with pleckstrin-like domain
MTSYVEDALVEGERILHLGRISWWSLAPQLLLGVLLLPLLGLGLVLLVGAFITHRSTELAVTNRRLIVKRGFIRRQTHEMSLSKVESLQVEQGLLGRMLNFGSVHFSGTGASQEPLLGIAEPLAFRKAFIQAQDGLRNAG